MEWLASAGLLVSAQVLCPAVTVSVELVAQLVGEIPLADLHGQLLELSQGRYQVLHDNALQHRMTLITLPGSLFTLLGIRPSKSRLDLDQGGRALCLGSS